MKKEFEENSGNGSLLEDRKVRELTLDDIQDLPLIDNDFFVFAVNDNKELADVLIKPALNYLGIENYEIISVKSEVSYTNLKNHSVRIDCEIRLRSGEHILVEIQNGHPEEMPLKRIRYEQDLLGTKLLKRGDTYTRLPDIISLIYTTEPLKNHDTGVTLNDFAVVDLSNGEIASDYGIRILVVNGKYKSEGSEEFSSIIEDLQKGQAEDVKNPVMRDIHLKAKNTEKGRTMLSDYIEERYGSIIREYEEELQKLQEEHLKDQEEHQKLQEQLHKEQEKNQEEIKKYQNLLKEYGIIFD